MEYKSVEIEGWHYIANDRSVTVYDCNGGAHASFQYAMCKDQSRILPKKGKAESYAKTWISRQSSPNPVQLPVDFSAVPKPYAPIMEYVYKGFRIHYGHGTVYVPAVTDAAPHRMNIFAEFSYEHRDGSRLICTPLENAFASALWIIDEIIIPTRLKKERAFHLEKGNTYVIQARPGTFVCADKTGFTGRVSELGELEYTPSEDVVVYVRDCKAQLQHTFLSRLM